MIKPLRDVDSSGGYVGNEIYFINRIRDLENKIMEIIEYLNSKEDKNESV